ncbi:ROK family protein [Leptolyngbya cf. ectocarpi LEGE 11479]|uniref:fructokinase n=1 Tax=Leptolyngbya cf. ectocarpi LEGE 11479 TaxID=1828722 RepID=A0A929F6R9_LEPEC|nr:ROK family protein [Leptolyngbya ectocarpi]MBE9067806.1 ROK family protein [Leptolyngbya cf. ectocarpi LEGE 11479]
MSLFGAIEAGGTKFVCAVGASPDDLRAEIRIPTTTPTETIAQVIDFFRQQISRWGPLDAIGVGAFGPVGTQADSSTFGWFLDTPKPGWQQIDFAGMLKQELSAPVGFDTDVNASALGEYHWGNGQGFDTFLYLTVGTGVGGGAVVNGQLVHGLLHPEMGHIRIPHDLSSDPFPGACPFHQDCLEGLASGFAIEKRWQQKAALLPADHPAWTLEAHYLAVGLVNFMLTFSPERIILGGGVMEQKQLFGLIRSQVRQQMSTYLKVPKIMNDIDSYIVPPKLGGKAGIMGAFVLAQQAAKA